MIVIFSSDLKNKFLLFLNFSDFLKEFPEFFDSFFIKSFKIWSDFLLEGVWRFFERRRTPGLTIEHSHAEYERDV